MADENDKTEKAETPAAEKPKGGAKANAEKAQTPAAEKPKGGAKANAEKPAAKAKAEQAEKPAAKAKADKAEPKAKAEQAEKPAAKAKAEKAEPEAKAAAKPKAAKGKAGDEPQAKAAKAGANGDGPARPVVRAQAKYVRSSARKARLVCDHIRGKSVEEARAILAFTPRAVARDWSKVLESAVANAEHNHELDGDRLLVKAAHADEGPTLKRFRPRAMGRATPIRKRTSHLTILLTPKE
jgi:ribosomal protein L22